MRMLIVGARAVEQWPVVSGTGVSFGEDLLKGLTWMTGVVLLITIGVGLLGSVCVLCTIRTCQLEMYKWQENQKWHDSQEA